MTFHRPHGLTLIWSIIRLVCFILLALHLGWSWWLILLIISYVEIEFS